VCWPDIELDGLRIVSKLYCTRGVMGLTLAVRNHDVDRDAVGSELLAGGAG
jgi:hypothetical protein